MTQMFYRASLPSKGLGWACRLTLQLLAAGWSVEQILENYPTLTPEALRAVFAFAAECVEEVQLILQVQR